MTTSVTVQSRHVTILLIDDLPLRRASIRSLLRDWVQEDGSTVDIIESDRETPHGEEALQPQLLVYNAGYSGATLGEWRDRVDELRQSFPEVPLVVISEDDGALEVIEALKAGVRGFISARTPPAIVFQTLHFILAGGVYFPPSALLHAQTLSNDPNWRRASPAVPATHRAQCSSLTERQAAVWRLLQRGHSNKVIARELAMCESTVKVHMRQIMRKLGATNRTQAALRSVELDLEGGDAVDKEEKNGVVAMIGTMKATLPSCDGSSSKAREMEVARLGVNVSARHLP